jgi:alcohol dehydrogenase class IV
MLAANGGNVEQYQMEGKQATKAPTLFVAIPTTAGTGAEATKTAVVTNNNNGLKKSLYHPSMIADIVILDPVLTLTLPSKTTAATGMDALSHAIESYVSLNANTFSEMFGLKAIEIINENLPKAFHEPSNIDARGSMLLASYLGGQAITAGIGIAHIMAQPLGALYHIPHGDACSIFLPAAMELNMPFAAKKYAKIAFALGVGKIGASDEENTKSAIKRVQDIQKEINAPSKLTSYIAATGEVDNATMIDCIKRTTGHITCNPKPLNEALMTDIFNMCK